jgi:hypothetical protein
MEFWQGSHLKAVRYEDEKEDKNRPITLRWNKEEISCEEIIFRKTNEDYNIPECPA